MLFLFSTPGDDPTEPVLIVDIYCNSIWTWSGIYPLQSDDYGGQVRELEDGEHEDLTVVYSDSNKTLLETAQMQQPSIHSTKAFVPANIFFLPLMNVDFRV
jgi:hypothetical protein